MGLEPALPAASSAPGCPAASDPWVFAPFPRLVLQPPINFASLHILPFSLLLHNFFFFLMIVKGGFYFMQTRIFIDATIFKAWGEISANLLH